MNKRGAIDLSVKALFGVFIVIISLLIIFTISRNKADFYATKEKVDYITESNSFLLTFISSPKCFTYQNELNQSIQGVLDNYKLDTDAYVNKDINCIDDFNSIYNFELLELDGKSKLYGLNVTDTAISEQSIKVPVNLVIAYNNTIFNPTGLVFGPGKGYVTSYFGQIPSFFGTIKKVCQKKKPTSFSLNTQQAISYLAAENKFCYSNTCFDPNFKCQVSDFRIEAGQKIVYINIKENQLIIQQ